MTVQWQDVWRRLVLGSRVAEVAEKVDLRPLSLRFRHPDLEQKYEEYLIPSRKKSLIRRFIIYFLLTSIVSPVLWLGFLGDRSDPDGLYLMLLLWVPTVLSAPAVCLIRFEACRKTRIFSYIMTKQHWSYYHCIMLWVISISMSCAAVLSAGSGFRVPNLSNVLYIVLSIIICDYMVNFHINVRFGAPAGFIACAFYIISVNVGLPNRRDYGSAFFMFSTYVSSVLMRFQKEFFHRVGFFVRDHPWMTLQTEKHWEKVCNRIFPIETTSTLGDLTLPDMPIEYEDEQALGRWRRPHAWFHRHFSTRHLYHSLLKHFDDPDCEREYQNFCATHLRESILLVVPLLIFLALAILLSRPLFHQGTIDPDQLVWWVVWCVVSLFAFVTVRWVREEWTQRVLALALIACSALMFAFHFAVSRQPIWSDFISLIWIALAVPSIRFCYMLPFQQSCLVLLMVNQVVHLPDYVTDETWLAVGVSLLVMVYVWISYVMLSVSSNMEKRFRAFYVYRMTVMTPAEGAIISNVV